MIRHIVIIQFQKKFKKDYVELMENTRPFLDQIPGILFFSVFQNDSEYVPEDIISVGIEIHFKDEDALKVFMNHPKHREANATFEKYLAEQPYMVLTHKIQQLA